MLKAFHGQYMSLLAEFSPEDCLEFLQQLHLFKTLANPSYMLAVCRRRRKEIESVFQQNGFAQTVQQCCSVQHDSKSDSEVLLEGEPDSLLMGESANSLGLALTDLQTSEVFLYYVMGRLKEALHVLLYKLKVLRNVVMCFGKALCYKTMSVAGYCGGFRLGCRSKRSRLVGHVARCRAREPRTA